MKKEATALTILTIISSILIPITSTIFNANQLPSEVMRLPHDLVSLGLVSNQIVTGFLTGIVFALIGWALYYKPLRKVYFFILYVFTLFLIAVEVFCIANFGLTISLPMTSIMADTNNTTEIAGFFETYFTFKTAIFVLLLCLSSWALWHYGEKIFDHLSKNKKIYISILVVLAIISLVGTHKIGGLTASTPFYKTIYCAKYWIKTSNTLNKMSADKTNKVEITKNNSDTAFIIFIIGESESRHFMGMYNPKYDSTPLCNKLIESGNMFAFTDTISMKSSTAQVMTPLLSFMDNTTETTDLTKYDPLVDVFTKAGYQAFWISNHEKITKDLSYATFMSSRCDYSTFTSRSAGNTEHVSWLTTKDEVIFKPLDEYIKNQVPQKDKNLFVMQIMGSHIRYHDRYPESFNHFKAADIKEDNFKEDQKALLAEYLNTVYYTDYFVNEVISRFKDKDAILFYISDHGEEMWQAGFQGHGPTNVSKYMVDIPFLIWTSDTYKEKRPDNIQRIKEAVNKPFMTDNLAQVMLDLANIETKQYDPTKSVVNPSYIIKDRVINGIKYEDLKK